MSDMPDKIYRCAICKERTPYPDKEWSNGMTCCMDRDPVEYTLTDQTIDALLERVPEGVRVAVEKHDERGWYAVVGHEDDVNYFETEWYKTPTEAIQAALKEMEDE